MGTDVFLALRGPGTEAISLYNNDLASVKETCDRGPDVPEAAVAAWSNHVAP